MKNTYREHFDLAGLLAHCDDDPDVPLQQLLETYYALSEDDVCVESLESRLVGKLKNPTVYKAFLAGYFSGVEAAWNQIEGGRPKLPDK